MEKEIIKEKLRCVFIILTILLVGVITFFSLRGCDNEKRRLKNINDYIQKITEVEIPDETKLLFRYSDDSFHNGLHEKLYIIEFEEEPTDWLEKNNFLTNTGENEILAAKNRGDFWHFFKRGYFREYFEENKTERITKEFVPNFDVDYKWLKIEYMYFYYFPETMRLMVYVPWI